MGRVTRTNKPPITAQQKAFGKGGFRVFQVIACNIACLAIAVLYYTWRDVYMHRRKQEQLRDRVAYMLWVASSRAA